ncbi:hypothetical protein ALP99_04770 [Pseudomonas syringae pv. tomato]|nr:hypothetical protein ALP99_04770 [Pseudomonas syringae pv. tomato]
MPSRSKSTSKAPCRELLVKHYVTSHGRFDYRADAPRRHAVPAALRPLCVCGAPRRKAVLRCQSDALGSGHLFAPRRLTLRDQSEQSPSPVSGRPTSSGSFALPLIRGPPQRAILGPVRLARRPASHPPDQRQSSAVTHVALCVVSAIAEKSAFFYIQ